MDWLFRFADPTIDWNYAMVTLVVRFIGVFVVMIVMQIALQVAARVIRRVEAQPAAAVDTPAGSPAAGEPITDTGVDAATAAAVGLALQGADDREIAAIALAMELEARPRTPIDPSERTTAWASAGRLQQLARNPR